MKERSCSHDSLHENGKFMVFFSYYFETARLDSVEYHVGDPCRENLWEIYLLDPSEIAYIL